jgi:hypothetical protein
MYMRAATSLAAEWERNDKAWERINRKRVSPKDVDEFDRSIRAIDKSQKAMFASFDAWRYSCKHINDPIMVSIEDIRAVVIDTLTDVMDELDFNIKPGLLGHKVAQVVVPMVQEAEYDDIPYCDDCG